MKIGIYDVSSNNASCQQKSSIRVKLNGAVLALVYMGSRSNPLGLIRRYPAMPERQDLVRQLLDAGVAPTDIEEILRMPAKQK